MVVGRWLALIFLLAQLCEGQVYVVRQDQPAQTIWGIGVEIESDSIGSGNDGLPNNTDSVPHDLIPTEKQRFYTEMMAGVRFVRLALGLYLRGMDPEGKYIIERFPGQMADLAEMQQVAGIDGYSVEYWSPPTYWKSNGELIGGSLASFNDTFLAEFADARVQDVKYLISNGLNVKWWGLQNEPPLNPPYSCCIYSQQEYYTTFKAVAPAIKAAFPDVKIHADSFQGQSDCLLLRQDPVTSAVVDAWTWHEGGEDSDLQIDQQAKFNADTDGKPVFDNEWEYFEDASPYNFVNLVQSIMNWMVFQNAPTFYWLHALKPTDHSESSGYGLGFWRPYDDDNFTHFPELEYGHWTYNPYNWNAVGAFIKLLPWDSVRLNVTEPEIDRDHRIMAWLSPQNKLGFVVTNRWAETNFTYSIDIGRTSSFVGHLFTPDVFDGALGTLNGPLCNLTLGPYTAQFWLES